MSKVSYSDEVWDQVRARFEAGESPATIEQTKGMPTRQGIWYRADVESWQRINEAGQALTPEALIPFENLDERQRLVVREMANGLTQKDAAAIAGVTSETVGTWKQQNPTFSSALAAARSVKTRRRLGKVEDTADWRAASWLLERDADSRNDYRAPRDSGGGFQGNTINVLGHVSLGFDRGDEPE